MLKLRDLGKMLHLDHVIPGLYRQLGVAHTVTCTSDLASRHVLVRPSHPCPNSLPQPAHDDFKAGLGSVVCSNVEDRRHILDRLGAYHQPRLISNVFDPCIGSLAERNLIS